MLVRISVERGKAMREFISGRLVSGGGVCEGCGRRLRAGEKVYSLAAEVEEMREYLYCQGCRPSEDELPEGVLSLEPALAVEEPGVEERTLGIEVRAGSLCTRCGHAFEVQEWLFVGVVEGLHSGFLYCRECYLQEMAEEAGED